MYHKQDSIKSDFKERNHSKVESNIPLSYDFVLQIIFSNYIYIYIYIKISPQLMWHFSSEQSSYLYINAIGSSSFNFIRQK